MGLTESVSASRNWLCEIVTLFEELLTKWNAFALPVEFGELAEVVPIFGPILLPLRDVLLTLLSSILELNVQAEVAHVVH